MKIFKLVMVALLLVSFTALAYAGSVKRTAKIIALDGIVEVKRTGEAWISAEEGMLLNEGDIIKTREDSTVMLNLDGSGETATVDLTENSQLKFAELLKNEETQAEQTLLDLAIGKILIKAQKLHSEEERFEVKTPTTIVGVRGTTFAVEVEALD